MHLTLSKMDISLFVEPMRTRGLSPPVPLYYKVPFFFRTDEIEFDVKEYFNCSMKVNEEAEDGRESGGGCTMMLVQDE